METPNPTPELDVSQIYAPALQQLGVTMIQVRATYANPVVAIEPGPEFPEVWRLLGFIGKGRFIFVALRYDDYTGKFAALKVDIADDLGELCYYLCRV